MLTAHGDEGNRPNSEKGRCRWLCSGRPVPMVMAALRWSTRDGKRRYGFGSSSWSYWRHCLAPATIQGDDPAATSHGGGASRDGGTQGDGGQGARAREGAQGGVQQGRPRVK
jgi:hypothetical protein